MINTETNEIPPVERWNFIDLIIITASIGIMFIAGALIFTGVDLRFGLSESTDQNSSLLISLGLGLLEVICLIVGVAIFGLRRRKFSWKAVLLVPAPRKWIKYSVLLGIIAIPLSSLVALIVQVVFHLPAKDTQLDFIIPNGFSWLGLVGMFLVGGILIPFAEELFFRGVYYQYFGQKWGAWIGIMISAIIFGIAHGDLIVASAAVVLGILLAWVYQKSQSLWSPFLIHAINNGFKILLVYVLVGAGINITGV